MEYSFSERGVTEIHEEKKDSGGGGGVNLVYAYEIVLENKSRSIIRPGDYFSPIHIDVEGAEKLIEFSLEGDVGMPYGSSYVIDGKRVDLNNIFFNRGEKLVFKLSTYGAVSSLKVNAKIAGIEHYRSSNKNNYNGGASVLIILLGCFGLFSSIFLVGCFSYLYFSVFEKGKFGLFFLTVLVMFISFSSLSGWSIEEGFNRVFPDVSSFDSGIVVVTAVILIALLAHVLATRLSGRVADSLLGIEK